jgi:serine/threonine-protein kinase
LTDLKPANIMLVIDPDMVGGERVKVLDFGIAKLAENQARGQAATRAGMFLGSPGYMSPEQHLSVKTVDERSDVYSLGVILYEMLAGKPPFVSSSDAELLALNMYAEPADLKTLAPNAKPEVTAFVHRMLRKKPQERPDSQAVLRFLNRQSGFPEEMSLPLTTSKPSDKAEAPVPSDSALANNDGETNYGPVGNASAPGPSNTASLPGSGKNSLVPRPRARAPRKLLPFGLALFMLAFLTGGLLVHRFRTGRAPFAPAAIHWDISSMPSDAEVLRAADQQPLGRTPFHREQLPAEGNEALVLRHPGYADLPLILQRGISSMASLSLSPVPTPPPAAAAPSPPKSDDEPAPSTKLTGRKEKRRKGKKAS